MGAGVIVALTEGLKRTGYVPKPLVPVISILLGAGIFYFVGTGTTEENVITGIFSALSAMGLYSGSKATVKGVQPADEIDG